MTFWVLVVLLFVKRADNRQRLRRDVISLQKANNHISLHLMALLFEQSPCFLNTSERQNESELWNAHVVHCEHTTVHRPTSWLNLPWHCCGNIWGFCASFSVLFLYSNICPICRPCLLFSVFHLSWHPPSVSFSRPVNSNYEVSR